MSDWDRQTAPGGAEGPQWVSAAEAADVAGVTPGTVRYWARNGLIVSEVVEGAAGEKTLVRLEEVLQHARQEGPGRPSPAPGASPAVAARAYSGPSEVVTELPARTSELAPILKSIPEIMAQLTTATDRAARAETKVEFLSAQVADLRRRLAEAEAGRDGGGEAAAMPEAWATAAPTEEPGSTGEDGRAVAGDAEPAASPGAKGWPAPPAETLRDELPEDSEPGPDTVDWTAGTPSEEPGALDEGVGGTPSHAGRPEDTLDDIWNQLAAPAEAVDPVGPVESARAEERARTGEAARAAGVDWHDAAGGPPAPPAPPGEDAPASAPRAANAPVPEGEDFYGPRRRRWFKRRS